jgi:diacylglycerol kinase family enzyme
MNHVWILHNPRAGRPGSARLVERAAGALARRGVSVQLQRPPTPADMQNAARAAVNAQANAVLVAGGDGSLGLVAAELRGHSTALGFLPVGTANVWAQEFGLPMMSLLQPSALERAALMQLDGQPRLTDCGECNGNIFLLWAGVGLDALVMGRLGAHRPISRHVGAAYNVLATFWLGRDWRGTPMRVVCDGRTVEGHYLLAVVANVRHYAALFTLTREARLDDGQMDVWLFAGRSYRESLQQSARLGLGRHIGHPGVTRLTGEAIELYTPAPQAVHADGEPLASTERIHIRVQPRALRVLVPALALAGLYGETPC